jgi:S-adenosylmethionine synthetase
MDGLIKGSRKDLDLPWEKTDKAEMLRKEATGK